MPKRMGPLFGDQLVTATELNRRAGAILDMALHKPVTITRNDQHFALLPRESVAQLSAATDQLSMFADAIRAIQWVQSGNALRNDGWYRWLNDFDAEELTDLSNELIAAITEVAQGEDWEAVETVIHEWLESSIAVRSEVLTEAFDAKPDPVPLTSPSDQTVEA